MYGLLVGFGLMFDKGQKQSSTLSCDSSYFFQLFSNDLKLDYENVTVEPYGLLSVSEGVPKHLQHEGTLFNRILQGYDSHWLADNYTPSRHMTSDRRQCDVMMSHRR